jgi:predicted DNA-binding ribbon-helix-helix protein
MTTKTESDRERKVRTSVSIEEDDYAELQRIADQRKVSVAWVIRMAVERFLEAENPLFKKAPR